MQNVSLLVATEIEQEYDDAEEFLVLDGIDSDDPGLSCWEY